MKRTILLVEDNAQNRYLVTFILERHGYEVESAPDGPSGLDMVANGLRPDMVLLDIQLPGIDGYEVARRLRDMPSVGDVPIVAVTAYAMPGDREKALTAGCNGYIEKPIHPETFVQELAKFGLPPAAEV